MKQLLFVAAIVIGFPALAQHNRKPYAVPTDYPETHSQRNVMIMGEAEAREAVLKPASMMTATRRYHTFIAQVVKSYEERLQLSGAESGMLIRALNGLGGDNPSKYAVHFRIEQSFRSNLDSERFAEWSRLTVYPEYLYSHLLNDPGQQKD